jgi:hypothetical protein
MLTADGIGDIYDISSLVGSGISGYEDLSGPSAQFDTPMGFAIDNYETIILADSVIII